jgi:hypothetical protein
MTKLIDYSTNILKTFSSNSKRHFANQAIIHKDYAGLKHLVSAINQDWHVSEIKVAKLNEAVTALEEQKAKSEYLVNYLGNATERNILVHSDALIARSKVTEEYSKISRQKNDAETQLIMAKSKSASDNYSIVSDAIDELDVEAVQIIMEQAKDSIFTSGYNLEYLFGKLFDNMKKKPFGFEDIEARRDKILKIGLDYIPKSFVTTEFLQTLSKVLSKDEFESFYKSKAIDLKDESFKSLDLKQYELLDSAPVLKINHSNANVVNLLLSRTYSTDISLEKIEGYYQNLYKLHPIAKEMLAFLAHSIADNNDFKIIFGKGLTSSYDSHKNIVMIDSDFQKEAIFNIESVIIHEFGHAVQNLVFNFSSLPFSLKGLMDVFSEYYNQYNDYMKDPYVQNIWTSQMKQDLIKLLNSAEVQELEKVLSVYEQAARKPIDHAATLMKFNISEYASYNSSKQIAEYVKDHSTIDLFHVNNALGISIETNYNSTSMPDNIFNNFYRVYLEEEIQCKVSSPYSLELSRAEIIKWGTEEFFPKLVSDLGIDAKQIHYLERVGDYVNRGEHLLEEDSNWHYTPSFKAVEQYVELIVRSMEFKAAGIDQANSFGDLDNFHMNYVSPQIHKLIEESYQQKMALYHEIMPEVMGDVNVDHS